jgi:hypothetical protein
MVPTPFFFLNKCQQTYGRVLFATFVNFLWKILEYCVSLQRQKDTGYVTNRIYYYQECIA